MLKSPLRLTRSVPIFTSPSTLCLGSAAFSTKSKKKISVQLLTKIKGLGEKGEIINVLPAFMRNFLHKENQASYVLPGQEPKIPVLTKAMIDAKKEELRQKNRLLYEAALAKKAAEATIDPAQIALENARARSRVNRSVEELTNLRFTEPNNTTHTTGRKITLNALDSFPPVLRLKRSSQTTGFLDQPITMAELTERISQLVDADVSTTDLEVILNQNGKSEVISELDFVGKYQLFINIPGQTDKFSRIISVVSSTLSPIEQNKLVRPREVKEE
ncbi:hypothetical protein NADFUDRAFT_47267 [Nadsonia fulvescens var. elongata DSM 6958]|uniref:Ribosomal protein L9 domain-containing protein n=1 Tax=Nadsonia fulvescens var. elongata DSM 6958 TaxID=857566 RepID=A0A1E3PGW4_9ASCO|nr:hypothetical protein NADFUDRAFT_47267 [Nadsonia fulvescens var. elongata DSM 6958]